ncbi:MAG: hypothetical protein ACP5LQ_09490, partial [Candidatus Methanodesulfokora sp.]
SKLMVAMVHTQLGKELLKRKLSKEMLWYYTRYKIAQLYNFLVEYIVYKTIDYSIIISSKFGKKNQLNMLRKVVLRP